MLRRAFLLMMVLSTSLVSGAWADRGGNGRETEVKGRITDINTTANPDRVTIRTTGGQFLTLAVTDRTEIKVDDGPDSIAGLEVGDLVEVKYDRRSFEAIKIDVEDSDDDDDRIREVTGTITQIDTNADPDRITIRLSNNALLTLKVTPQTLIEVEGNNDAEIADLEVGDRVEVKYDRFTFVATRIKAEDDDDDDRLREVRGVITSVDTNADPDRITIRLANGATLTLAVTNATDIDVEGDEDGDIGDLTVGDRVEVKYDRFTFVAVRVHIEDNVDDDDRFREVRGVITSINTNADPDRITIRLQNGSVLTVTVTPATQIDVEGDTATIADLAVGDQVEVKYDRFNFQAVRIHVEDRGEQRIEARGTLVEIDGNLALIDRNGDGQADLRLTLTDNTRIRFNNLELDRDELDLLLGLPVKVEYLRGSEPGTGELLDIRAETQFAVTLEGVVESVNVGDRVITIRSGNKLIDITIPEGVNVLRGGTQVALGDIAVGERIRVVALLDQQRDDGVALRADLLPPVTRKINGRIIAVNGNTITLEVGRRQEVEFDVAPDAEITLNNRTSSLADLAEALDDGRKIQAQVTFRELPGDDLAVDIKANANRGRR